MKLICSTFVALAFVKQARAGFALIEEAVNAAIRANQTAGGPMLRSFAPLTNSAISTIRDGWGCWCFFDDDSYQGRGNPLNDVDAYCKVLQQGYECFEMDDGNTCQDPWDVPYTPVDLQTVVNEDYETACQVANGRNNCAKRACIIESRFSDKIMKYFNTHGVGGFDTSILHSDPAWDMHQSCPIKVSANSGSQHKQCCGEYPMRFPYKAEGDRECCQVSGVTYDKGLFDCCADGSIELGCPLE